MVNLQDVEFLFAFFLGFYMCLPYFTHSPVFSDVLLEVDNKMQAFVGCVILGGSLSLWIQCWISTLSLSLYIYIFDKDILLVILFYWVNSVMALTRALLKDYNASSIF